MVKNLLPMQKTWVQSLGWEDLLEKEMPTHFSILAWEIPKTEKPGSYSPWGRKESGVTERLNNSSSANVGQVSEENFLIKFLFARSLYNRNTGSHYWVYLFTEGK